jgi:hypothetical protein
MRSILHAGSIQDRLLLSRFFCSVAVLQYMHGWTMEIVDAFLERQILNKNRRRCSLHRGGRSARRGRTVRGLVRGAVVFSAQGRTVRGLGPDGPRPGARLGLLCLTAGRSAPWGPDGPRVRRGGGSRRRRLDLAPGRDPVGEKRS